MTENDLEELLSRPSDADVAAMAGGGDLVVLGASGKMGPSLARLARRASDAAGAAGAARRVIGVARFTDGRTRDALERSGVETIACDLLDGDAVSTLPRAPHVVHMVGHKFGTSDDPARTWGVNVLAAANAAAHFRGSRFVVFSTGNVYPLVAVDGGGAVETDPPAPLGEYARSALGRERIVEFLAVRYRTPTALLRLNYAVEPRYGVLRDVADRVCRGETIDLRTGHVNVIWQRDACSVALRCLAHCALPPLVLNVTGPDTIPIRRVARLFAERFGTEPAFEGTEAATALLSDASRMVDLFGAPDMSLEAMIDAVARWVQAGGRALGQPTHYDERDGEF